MKAKILNLILVSPIFGTGLCRCLIAEPKSVTSNFTTISDMRGFEREPKIDNPQ